MNKKKLFSLAMASALSVGTLVAPVGSYTDALAKTTYSQETESHKHTKGPFDLAIANDEKLIEMLKEEGKVSKDASIEEAEEALQQFLEEKQEGMKDEGLGQLHELEGELNKEQKEKMDKQEKVVKEKAKKRGGVAPVQEEIFNGEVRKDNVLVLLIEFPDYPHNSIQPEDTDMYYEDYVKEHYQEMVFGENGYTGPNGETLISMKQYYEQQSGGSYTVDGQIGGWYTATKPYAEYGGNDPERGDNDKDARSLVREALDAAAHDPNLNLSDFDQEDRYDLDGDGNTREPDGLVDHLMIVHSAVGEEAGGGSIGSDAIWSHRWNLGGIYPIAGTTSPSDNWGGMMAAYDYTVQPADGAAGVFSHEYGHDLGLPDEYDTQYTGQGEPVSYWSIMSSGSWAGQVPGTEPTGFSPWAKEFLQTSMGGNWMKYGEVDIDDLDKRGYEYFLDQANTKGTNLDALRVNLPDKKIEINTPFSGQYEYYSQKGDNLNNSMTTSVDLTNVTNANLSFKAWYDIESDYDYASVQVLEGDEWTSIPGNITTTEDPFDINPGHGITGKSDGWIDATFDLSSYAGKDIELRINYLTDGGYMLDGIFVDDVVITGDDQTLLSDDGESDTVFTFDGFEKSEGFVTAKNYYLLEWRSQNGVDAGLGHIKRGNSLMSFDPGLIVWYVDNSYTDNWVGNHPGEGFLGVVDADQKVLKWSDKSIAQTRYQVHDAAFNNKKGNKMYLDYVDINGLFLKDNHVKKKRVFKDSKSYMSSKIPDAGRLLPELGLHVKVLDQAKDGTVGKIVVYKK
ncbi:immune inhibitor A [Bacillus carboniphilus]|uniref:Immune inhibitor A n=1 Tax=Bacillus carboniphilus TaxID=86663 RepID=A0ABY9JW00_9BACI|nr:immune inhibitor A domain-containing protein [Bacillus carboniphilus]WLR41810.1 immune inhibitor A [Bacillus carboniphilus]